MLGNLDGKIIKGEYMEEPIILYEDNHVIVALKPQGVPCCEDETKDLDMLTIIKNFIKVRDEKPGNVYLGLVHRLDRPTGGVMVFAKTSKAASRLSEQMKNGDFQKIYYTVLVGELSKKQQTLTNYLKKNPINNMVYVCGQTVKGAKFAELDYQLLESVNGLSLADVRLHTGRSHQIRVQMNAIGCPVYGDMRYGGEKAKKGYLALWAYYLAFTHPVSKERMVFRVQPPKENNPWNLFNTEKSVTIIKPQN